MKLFDKISLLIRSKVTPERETPRYEEVPPDAPTIEYPEVTIDRANRTATVSTNAQSIDEASGINTTGLREKMLNNLSDDELNNLALDMNIAYADLPGGKGRKVLELMTVAQQNGQLPLLIELCELTKPAIDWSASAKPSTE